MIRGQYILTICSKMPMSLETSNYNVFLYSFAMSQPVLPLILLVETALRSESKGSKMFFSFLKPAQ